MELLRNFYLKILLILIVLIFGYFTFMEFFLSSQVNYVIIKAQPISRVISAIGRVRPNDIIHVQPLISSTILNIFKNEGDNISKDEILAKMNCAKAQQKIHQAQAELDSERENVKQKEREYYRYKKLYNVKAINKKLFEESELAYKRSLNMVIKLQAELQDSIEQTKDYTIHSPFNGVVTKRFVDVGQVVNPQTVMFDIMVINKQQVEIEIDEIFLNQITLGEKAFLKPTDLDSKIIEGRVEYIAPTINENTGGFIVRIGFNKENLKPGQSVDVNIPVSRFEKAIVIPRSALDFLDNKNYVLVVKDNKIYRQEVTILDWPDSKVIVTEGLMYGDYLVIEKKNFKEGSKVKAVEYKNEI